MSTAAPEELDLPVAAVYPSQRETAKILGIKESRLSRANDGAIRVSGGIRFPPQLVLELAAKYRESSLNEVAGALLEHVRANAPEHEDHIKAEIDEFFATLSSPPLDPERFLDEARRTLPRRLFEQVRRAYEEGDGGKQIALASSDAVGATRAAH